MSADFLSGESLFRDVVTYCQLGEHRTATAGEERTTEWIAAEMEKAGLKPGFQKFALRQFFVEESSLVVGDRTLDCFPWWYPCSTGSHPIRARFAPFGAEPEQLNGKIALVRFPRQISRERNRSAVEKTVQDMAKSGALAVVAVLDTPSAELAAINTSDEVDPWSIPVVLAGAKDEQTLALAAGNSTDVSLFCTGTDNRQAKARNVFGRWGKNEDVIVISTPKSGWFRCGGERGPGVAIVLALARWIGVRQPQVSYWLDFNSGHELFNLGTRRFVAGAAPPPDVVRCWLHLGANIATWDFVDTGSEVKKQANPGKYPVVCSREDILPLAQDAFSAMPEIKPTVGQGIGEFGPVMDAGYRGFGVYGGRYRYFHTPSDGPQGTAPELLEPMLQVIIKALSAIEALPRK